MRSQLEQAVATPAVAVLLASELVVMGLAGAARRLPGTPSLPAPAATAAVAVALLVAQVPLYLTMRRAVWRRDERSFRAVTLTTNTVQLTLVALLCQSSHPSFTTLGALILCAFAFNDATLLHDGRDVRLAYAVPFGVLAGGTLLLEGATPRAAITALICAAGTVVSQFIVHVVGQRARESAAQRAEAEALVRRAEVLRREREVLRQSCNILSLGMASASLAHDLRNAAFVLVMNQESVADLAARLQGEGAADDAAVLSEVATAITRLERELAERLSRLRDAGELALTPARDLVHRARADADARLALERRAAIEAFAEDLEDLPVFVSEGHVSAISNLLINGARYGGGRFEVHGERASPEFYRLTLRDFGVDAADRNAILGRVRASMEFHGAPSAQGRSGYGIALGLARLETLRVGGAFDAQAPEVGNGIQIRLVLPLCDPDALPSGTAAADQYL
jgi:hypothetical protein